MSVRKNSLQGVLKKREINILSAFYYDQATQVALARRFRVSQPRISQIISQATAKLVAAGMSVPQKRIKRKMVCIPVDQMDRLRQTRCGAWTWKEEGHT